MPIIPSSIIFFVLGSYIANRVSDKITHLTDNIWVCRSGSAADTQAISDFVRYAIKLVSIQFDEEPVVETAAFLARDVVYKNKDNLLAGMILAGYDSLKGPQVYQVTLGGTLVREKFAISGSGSTYITGYCDEFYREKMSKEECLKFVKSALQLAMARDGSSGGVIRTVVITKDGYEKEMTSGDELSTFYQTRT